MSRTTRRKLMIAALAAVPALILVQSSESLAARSIARTTRSVSYAYGMAWRATVTNVNAVILDRDSAPLAAANCNVVLRVVGEDGLPIASVNTTVSPGGKTNPLEGALPAPLAPTSFRVEYAVPRSTNSNRYCSTQNILVSVHVVDTNGFVQNVVADRSVFVPGRVYVRGAN